MKNYIFITLTILSTFTSAQNKDSVLIRRIANEVLTNARAYENLRYLCKEVGPRLSGSANAQQAVIATRKMLLEAGADTAYLVPCMVPHWVRGEKETGFIESSDGRKHELRLCALGNSVGTGINGIKSPVVEVKSFEELDRLGETVIKGKIVFFNFRMNPTYINTFRAYGESGIGRRIGPAQASKYGAKAVMVRSLATGIDPYPHTGATQYNDSFPKIPAVAISTADAEWLSMELKKNNGLQAYFRTTSAMLADTPSFNVVGEIRGSEFAREIISVGGHLDSWDLAEGAQDDGAGIVQSIEVVRVLKALGIRPRRTIRAVLFMNEENGGRGAAAYLAAARQQKEHHIFALESDAGGFTPRAFSLEMEKPQFDKIMKWKNLFYDYGIHEISAGGSGSDIEPLKEVGAALAGLLPDSQRYFDLHHAPTDTFESVSERELNLGAVNMAALVWLVSEYGL